MKLRSLSLTVSLSVFVAVVSAQNTDLYKAGSIPASLLNNANAVYRLDEALLDVSSSSQFTFKVHQVVTILNSEGAEHLRHVLRFDKFQSVDDVE
ncbi:MAG: hypothetical protein ACJ75F_06005, partial [Flavisolibacter sp.]